MQDLKSCIIRVTALLFVVNLSFRITHEVTFTYYTISTTKKTHTIELDLFNMF